MLYVKRSFRCRSFADDRRSRSTFGRVRNACIAGALLAAWLAGAAAGAPPTDTEARADRASPEPRGDLTLRDAFGAALVGNPTLAALSFELRVRQALAVQARALPNPALVADVENVGGAGNRREWEAAETTLSLAQLIELGGKRASRRRTAELEQNLAGWDHAARRLDVLAETAKGFVGVLAAQERLALASELLGLAEQSVHTVAATVRAGAVSPVEETRARVALGRAQSERFRAERELAEARLALAARWGQPQAHFERALGTLTAVSEPPPLDALLSALPRNPDVKRLSTEAALRRAAVDAERARRVPDITVSAGGRRFSDDGSGALVFGFSVPLPVFDQNRGNVLAAEQALSKAKHEHRATAVAVESAVRIAHQTLGAIYEQGASLRDRTIPEARRTYAAAQDAYARGLFRYLEVLDAQRTLFELRGEYLASVTRYHETEAELARLVGDTEANHFQPSGAAP
jgi:cobalt-zinc-cadmium efflux system outer membrane protein